MIKVGDAGAADPPACDLLNDLTAALPLLSPHLFHLSSDTLRLDSVGASGAADGVDIPRGIPHPYPFLPRFFAKSAPLIEW